MWKEVHLKYIRHCAHLRAVQVSQERQPNFSHMELLTPSCIKWPMVSAKDTERITTLNVTKHFFFFFKFPKKGSDKKCLALFLGWSDFWKPLFGSSRCKRPSAVIWLFSEDWAAIQCLTLCGWAEGTLLSNKARFVLSNSPFLLNQIDPCVRRLLPMQSLTSSFNDTLKQS